MIRLRLHGAAFAAVKSHFDNNESFSAYDITQYIRDKLDEGEWELWNGGDASTVKHDTVRAFVTEMVDNDLFYGDYSKSNVMASNGARYIQYTPIAQYTEKQDYCDDDSDEMFFGDATDDFERKTSLTVNNVIVEKTSNGVITVTSPSGISQTL